MGYEPELRNQAIITLLWDLDARPHEVTALRIKDIILDEQYGEGTIPSNTKTGGGPILLTSSFTYVRDWINKHPFKNEPNARLICNLCTGAPLRPNAIWQVLDRLRQRIKRLVESGSITDDQKKQLADLESQCAAKIAERELFLKGELAKAIDKGDAEAMEQLEKQLSPLRLDGSGATGL